MTLGWQRGGDGMHESLCCSRLLKLMEKGWDELRTQGPRTPPRTISNPGQSKFSDAQVHAHHLGLQ